MSSASSHSESRSIIILTHRSRVLDHPSGDSRLTFVLSSVGGAALTDSEAAEVLATMRSCFNVDSTMTTSQLVEVIKHYYISSEYELHVPLPGERPYDAFPSGFMGGAPSNNKVWKSYFFFISYRWSWSFLTEWTSRMVNNSVPVLSTDEIELVEILQGILSTSKGVKDMNETWLAEVGLSPVPRGMFFLFVYHAEYVFLIVHCHVEMFNLEKMKSGNGAGSRSVAPSVIHVSASIVAVGYMTEKRPSIDEGSSLRKRSKRVTPGHLTNASWSTARVPAEKGKELVDFEEAPEWGYTIRELCDMEDRVRVDKYFASIMTWLKTVEGQDPMVSRWALIDRVHDASRLVWSQHERILVLRAANKELKLGASQDLVTVTKLCANGLEEDINKLQGELESLKNQRREMEQEVGVQRSSLDGARNDRARLEGDVLSLTEAMALLKAKLKADGLKAVATYKASHGFESGLKKMRRVSYEFWYWVALKLLQGKPPEIAIESRFPLRSTSDTSGVKCSILRVRKSMSGDGRRWRASRGSLLGVSTEADFARVEATEFSMRGT
ncbi:hypothetical protein B296_00028126 [Ensete ventricosum]|uniref:Uncharacterized protein n=1 Tax=Ensete ventricosum TaxID=4639 RepID=A0A427A749_ENSVE|nr:hypothetical protein B296_00028126 [Ensete ventricosum]